MKQRNGFAIKEMVILCAGLAIFFIIAITRISFALEEAKNESTLMEEKNHAIILAAETYAKANPDKFKESETFLFGSDLINEGYLLDIDDTDYQNVELKVWKENETFHAEVVE